jgi:hypothetical protein
MNEKKEESGISAVSKKKSKAADYLTLIIVAALIGFVFFTAMIVPKLAAFAVTGNIKASASAGGFFQSITAKLQKQR